MTMLLLEWVITSIFLILTVLALRAAFGKRVSARLRYALWAVVLLRLLVPVQLFTSPLAGTRFFSERRTEQTVTRWPITSEAHVTPGPDDVLFVDGQIGASTLRPDPPQTPGAPVLPDAPEPPTVPIVAPAAPAAPDLTKLPAFLGWVWLGGCAALAVVLTASNLRFALRLRRSRVPLEGADCPLPVYTAAGLPSPCLFGLARPAVYVTPEAAADPAMLRHVIAHEYTHFRQGDHLWSLLRCAALAAHWWNPLVWVSVKLSRRDGELACDEGALKRLGDGERLAYGNTLLALVTAKPNPGDLLCFATTMAGEKRSLKERISRIAHAPKRWLWAAVAVVLVTALACACAFSAAEEPEQTDGPGAELPELNPTYSMSWRNTVLVEGLGGTEAEWFDHGSLDFDDAAFCCPGLADRSAFGHASWTDETRTAVLVMVRILDDRVPVSTEPVGCIVDLTPLGFTLRFSVDLDSGTVLERNFKSYIEGETVELTDREMAVMARTLAPLLTGAEEYYMSWKAEGPEPTDMPYLNGNMTFSLIKEETVRIEGCVDGIELEHTLWFSPSWFAGYDSKGYPLGMLEFELPLCGGEVVCSLDARWTDESRSAVSVTAAPMAMLSSYTPSGWLVFTVDLSKGTLLEMDGYIPKLHANAPELVPSEAEAVRAARVAAKLLAEAEAYYQSNTGHSHGGEFIEPPIIEQPLVLEGGECAMIIAEVLETTDESAVMWDIEYTKISCRLVYGYKASLYRYDYKVSEQGEFTLYLSDNALRQLGQAEMFLLCLPKHPYPPYEGYAADYIIPIADGGMVLEEEWRSSLPVVLMNDEIQRIAEKQARGEKLSETERLAPASLLETGMTVEEVIAFLDTWEKYCAQVSADFAARRAELYGWG